MIIPPINYVVNPQGQKTLIQINIEDWENIVNALQKMENMISLKTKLKNDFQEIKQIQNGEKKGTPLNDFLNEL